MSKVIVTALALSALVATGCQTLGFMSSSEEPTSATKPKAQPAQPTQSKPQEYEQAPDLSNAEMLTTKHAGASISADDYQGNLITDAAGPISMDTNPDAVRSGVALSSNLEPAPGNINAQLGAADPYSTVSETDVDNYGNLLNGSMNAEGANNRSGLGESAQPVGSAAPNYEQIKVTPVLSVNEARGLDDGSCSMTLHYEASGLARSLIAELAGRLRSEQGKIFVGPTIIDREYEDCISDLSGAIKDGLAGNSSFEVVAATTNLNNIIAQNIGSATILPSMIHQCRAADIPYLVVSQVRKTGDKAALTLRIIRTADGITLNQVYRRLSQ